MHRAESTRLVLALALATLGGCAPDPTRQRAVDAMSLTARALDLVDETSGSEALGEEARAAIDPARADAHRWLEHAQGSVDAWSSSTSTSLAFATMAPCLGRSLGRLRERLARYDRPIPESLRRAEAIVRTATDLECATRRRSRAQRDRPTTTEQVDARSRDARADREETDDDAP